MSQLPLMFSRKSAFCCADSGQVEPGQVVQLLVSYNLIFSWYLTCDASYVAFVAAFSIVNRGLRHPIATIGTCRSRSFDAIFALVYRRCVPSSWT